MSSAFFDEVMEQERTALVTEQRMDGAPCFSAVGEIGIVRDKPHNLRSRHPVNLEALGATSFVQACPTLGYRFLWVHVDSERYREDYQLHLQRWYGTTAEAIPADLHVDHLFSRKRARLLQLSYIRLVLLPRGINSSHGAGYERQRTSTFGVAGRTRSIDTVMLMKLFGFRSPPTNGRITPEIARFGTMLGGLLGEDSQQLQQEIANLLDVAKRSRG